MEENTKAVGCPTVASASQVVEPLTNALELPQPEAPQTARPEALVRSVLQGKTTVALGLEMRATQKSQQVVKTSRHST